MGLVNARNLRKAKELLEKNRHKVGDVVGKATEKIDKASGGKTSNFTKKAEEAARKYSAGSSATHHGQHPDAVSSGSIDVGSMSREEAEIRRAEAQAKAAAAMAGLAEAANGLLGKAQQMAEQAGMQPDGTIIPPQPPNPSQAAHDVAPPIAAPPPLPDN